MTVLLVEDDDGDALLVEDLLAATLQRARLTRGRTFADALGKLDAHVDCVLLDLRLPDAAGLDTVIRVRTHAPDIPLRPRGAGGAGARAEPLDAELEQFAYVASHDLQEPLRKVASFCQALERRYHGQLDERADQYIDFAVDGAKRMQVLINDLLAFSRVGRSGRELEPVDLNDVLAQAKRSLASSLADSGAIVSVEQLLPVVRGDPTLLLSLFQNLIGNAIKFRGSEPPVVRLSALARNDQWELAFSDNGISIDPEYSARIFVVFQRLHTKEAYPGTGMGLAMCRKIVEYHGGRMWLEPDRTLGAEFRFTLPIAKEDAHDRRADLGPAR